MKFSLFVHMERLTPDEDQRQLYEEMIELCRVADDGGMDAIWTGEHHGMNFTIAPNPLLNLVDLARRTKNVRLGTSTIIAPFWHPIRLAGEAAMADIIMDGRLDLGIARGAYPFEYERLSPGLDAWTAGQKMREIIPAVQALWKGDYTHDGAHWKFPKTTSAPLPLQAGGPPIWVAARDPNSHEFAVANGCNVQVTPMAQPDTEVQDLMAKFNAACAKHPDRPRPKIMVLRHTYVADSEADADLGAQELSVFFNYFAAWFQNKKPIDMGLLERMTEAEMAAAPQYAPAVMRKNHIVGQPAEVIERVKSYQAMGYDEFSIWIDSGMSHARKKASLQRFITEVMPAFQKGVSMDRFQLYIDGAFVDGAASFESLDPATGTPWAQMPEAREADVNRAVEAAHRAFRSGPWPKLTPTQRGKLLFKLADLVQAAAPRLAQLETRDTGKIIRETSAQIAYVADYYRYYAGLADKIEGAHLPIDKPDMEVWLRREPIGVVAAIVPWNSQLFLSAVKLGPALAAGCTVILKASEDGPAPLLEFAKLIHEAGFPPGVVNVITGFGPLCGQMLTTHPKVAHIAFTGGPGTARAIIRNSAENLASTSLELGGKSPFIVFDDADLDSAANAQVSGIFAATGQSCVAGSRLLIQRGAKDAFLAKLKAKAEAIRIAAPSEMTTEVGPLCTQRQRAHIEATIAASLAEGATLITGGTALPGPGFYFPPTILDCSNAPNAPALKDEFFGPVLSVVTFDTEDEAIALANDTAYGLASGVFTTNLTRAHRMIRAIRAGVVWVNTYRAVSPIAPFGGHGLSGHGREGGLAAALDYTTTKTVWLRTSDDPIPDPFVMR